MRSAGRVTGANRVSACRGRLATAVAATAVAGAVAWGAARCSSDDDATPRSDATDESSASPDEGPDDDTTPRSDATDESNASPDEGPDDGEAGVDDVVGEGGNCANNGSPGCGAGLLCVQTAPPYCSSDYIGRCEPLPGDCSGEPEAVVCDCDGISFRNACEARRAGEARLLAPCP